MPTLSPQTLTRTEQAALLAVTAAHPHDHLAFSFALGTGLRLAEIVGLEVGDFYSPSGQPKSRVRIQAESGIDSSATERHLVGGEPRMFETYARGSLQPD